MTVSNEISPLAAFYVAVRFAVVVPAAPGFYAVAMIPHDDGVERIRRNPIIAWGIPERTAANGGWMEGALPICLEQIDQHDVPFVLRPDGIVMQGDWGYWDSLAAWRADMCCSAGQQQQDL